MIVALLIAISTSITGCAGSAKVSDIGCPVPDFLATVEPSPLKKGEDLRAALPRRTAELETANSRIDRARSYIATTCAVAVPGKKKTPGK